jgi:hypothetical protein
MPSVELQRLERYLCWERDSLPLGAVKQFYDEMMERGEENEK